MEGTPRKALRLDAIIRTSQQDGRTGDSYRSPGQQRNAIERWAAAHNILIAAWHDATRGNHSAKTVEREEVRRVVERVRARQTNGAVVMSLDRFSRAPLMETLTVYKQIEDAGGRMVATDMPFDDPTSPEAEFIVTNMLTMHRYQWRKTAQRYERNRREAIEDGKAVGGAPFGYRFKDPTPTGRGRGVRDSRLVVIEELRPIVRELFERKAAGATWLELARWLDTAAPKPNGTVWARNTVRDMIGRRTYLGEVYHGEHRKVGAHEALVTPALWRRAQGKPGRRTPRGTYLLSGLVRCAGCGRSMRGTKLGRPAKNGGEPTRVYTCETRECEAKATVMVDRLDAEVVEQLFAHLDAFHVQIVDDDEIAAVRADRDQQAERVRLMAESFPSHPAAIAAHTVALDNEARTLDALEDRLDALLTAKQQSGPDASKLRDSWPNLTLEERREILQPGIDAVLVRRASRRGPGLPVRDRILVLFTGAAPDGLLDGHGPVRAWTWDDDARSPVSTT